MVCGNMKCLEVELIPPFYDLIPAVFLFSSYADTHSLLIHYDPRVISRERARKLLGIFLEEIDKIAAKSEK